MANAQKFYVVWQGRERGIFTSWADCEQQVKGFEGARYKAFKTQEEAETAFNMPPSAFLKSFAPVEDTSSENSKAYRTTGDAPRKNSKAYRMAKKARRAATIDGVQNPPDYRTDTVLPLPPEVSADALAVDAACAGNPGRMEYRAVYLKTGQEVFHFGPVYGTNNIGEFLAIVHALALLKQKGVSLTIYSDSYNALLWVRGGKCKTKLARTDRTEALFQLIARAERWLESHAYDDIPIKKWETARWGEIPADFGRK